MAEGESGYKWWIRYVVVPLLGGGVVVALVTAYLSRPVPTTAPNRPTPATASPRGSKPPTPRSTQAGPDPQPTEVGSAKSAGTASDPSAVAVTAMQWIESRCGPGIELVVPSPPGSSLDQAARSLATALYASGVKPVPIVTSRPGVFMAKGVFSLQKFDDWQRSYAVKDGCLLVLVPDEVREQFARPRLDATFAGKAYGIVLPRGILSDAITNWNTVFVKASRDPDFMREVERAGLKVDVVPL